LGGLSEVILVLAAPPFSALWPWIIGSLAIILLLSGIDDLIPTLICVANRSFGAKKASESAGSAAEGERSIAIFIPCWRESEVIEKMIRHNLAAIRYRNFAFFIGVYPNDEPTIAVTHHLAQLFRNVHVAECPHAGPTSKADCLNWIYQRMLLYEDQNEIRFDTVVLHDAEDLIHPDALATINRERSRYAMVQIPVLPLPTRIQEVTHGVYCDEFAEFQKVDMPARQLSGAFIPSNGVGTGFAREILEGLAAERHNMVFDPASLTEDYEIGVHIHQAGYRQRFVPLKGGERGLIVTREYFPRSARSAIRQRTRWVTGIALQCWERSGWKGSPWCRYWFWRDRKGLFANPLSFLTNVLFAVGLLDWCASAATHRPWLFAVENPSLALLCWLTLVLQCVRLGIRMLCAGRVYGWTFALGVPLRCFHGNFLNCCASVGALWLYTRARFAREQLAWLKTEHAYPSREALLLQRRELDDVLVDHGYISQERLVEVKERMPAGCHLEEYLVAAGILSDKELVSALSLQSGVPAAQVDHQKVRPRVARTLPAHVERRFGVVPFGVDSGRLLVATQRVPAPDALDEMKSYTRLRIEPQLVTKENYEALRSIMYS
jgi:adsorption protein B